MRFTITIFFILTSLFSFSQRDIQGMGQWRHHIPYHLGNSIADAGDKIYCGTKLGVYSYDKESGELETYTKVEGLNDVEVSTISYYKPLDILLIAYKNANIDIIQNNTIINLSEIERKQIVGTKTINHIYFHNDIAYISCSFGVVVYDLKKLEVIDTYASLGKTGEQLNVLSATVAKDSLFLATEVGVLSGSIGETSNLLDFNNWNHISDAIQVESIANVNNELITYQNDSTYLMKRNGSNWDTLKEYGKAIINIFEGNNEILILTESELITTDLVSESKFSTLEVTKPVQALHDGSIYWFCGSQTGIIKYENEAIEKFTPNGPTISLIFKVTYSNNKIFINRGGYGSTYKRQYGEMITDYLSSSGWNSIGYWQDTLLNDVADITTTVQNSDGDIYMSSHGFGLVKKSSDGTFEVFNHTNSLMKNAQNNDDGYDRISDIVLDEDENLWMTNHGITAGDSSIIKLSKEGVWERYAFPKVLNSNFPERITIDNEGNKWVTLTGAASGAGVMVFNEGLDESRLLTVGFEQGDLHNTKITDIGVDKEGAVWLVGRDGVSFFSNPAFIFEGGEDNDAVKPIFDGRPLLEEEFISAIAIDGGNRKWVGSDNGLWLMDPTGTKVILNFNTDNSPLPTNKINDIEINQETGEVFIATDLGLVSYRGDATLGNNDCKELIKVFPNPVEPNFKGNVGITGLTSNAEIKITDTWGNLIYETTANGGAASWDVKNYNGIDASSGVYLILVNGTGRKKSCVTRLAIIR